MVPEAVGAFALFVDDILRALGFLLYRVLCPVILTILIAARTGAAIASDRTLGGLCDWVEAEATASDELGVEGGLTVTAAAIPIRLHYATTDPLG